MFVFPHKIILKTCGTTTLLLGLPRILELAHAALAPYGLANFAHLPASAPISSLPSASTSTSTSHSHSAEHTAAQQAALGRAVQRVFYSRKSFMFPERQKGPHRDWMSEVAMLDGFFAPSGAAYTVGRMNGDHWLLYMASPADAAAAAAAGSATSEGPAGEKSGSGKDEGVRRHGSMRATAEAKMGRSLPVPASAAGSAAGAGAGTIVEDQTLEILMTHLSPASCARFHFDGSMDNPLLPPTPPPPAGEAAGEAPADGGAISSGSSTGNKGTELGLQLSQQLGLTDLFEETTIDAFAFEPCGYSANAVVLNRNSYASSSSTTSSSSSASAGAQVGSGRARKDGYWTIHVTPEEGSSYASFETNVALGVAPPQGSAAEEESAFATTAASAAQTSAPAGGEESGKAALPLALPHLRKRPTDLVALIRRVIATFEPGKMSITLFVSSDTTGVATPALSSATAFTPVNGATTGWSGESAALLHTLHVDGYRRTDRIAYEFEGYDLVFVSFEKL